MTRRTGILLILLALQFTACKDDEDTYPSIITEFVDVHSNSEGVLFEFTNDQAQTYQIMNTLEGYDTSVVYRSVCGYVPEGSRATIYQLLGVAVLRDSTAIVRHDPVTLLSAWQAGEYINMQLAPLTQGGRQCWGYAIDSIAPKHIYLSLHHDQNSDPTSYTQNVYASIYIKHIEGYNVGDTISFALATFDGWRHYTFVP
ncbi:MAG: hypothetical protein K5945_06365 [Bacteroidaceae bacterium]|nr:hypothetical protein [Bacteroidaceae bacterium]